MRIGLNLADGWRGTECRGGWPRRTHTGGETGGTGQRGQKTPSIYEAQMQAPIKKCSHFNTRQLKNAKVIP